MNILAKTFAASLAAALAISSAQAGILGFGTRVDTVALAPNTTAGLVPLTDSNATTLTFRTVRANTRVVVTYNAECAALSGTVGERVDLWIAVDGRTQVQQFGFCSALAVATEVPVAGSRRAVIRVPTAGLHTVGVFAKLSEGTTTGKLDDSSIVIED